MQDFRFTPHFEQTVLQKRPYLKPEWCVHVIENSVRCEPKENNHWRFWAQIPELGDRYLRVVTLDDKVSIHNAFPD